MGGIITFSIEIELAWGLHDLPNFQESTKSISPNRQKETETLNLILQTCRKYDVEFTFDIVGHLFYSECAGEHPGPHPKGWFERDPGTNIQSDPRFYAPDLVEMIRETELNHEICTHTFSHVPCGEVPKEVVQWEINKSNKVHEEFLGEEFISFVPPRHSPPPRDVLNENGIEIIREPHNRSPTKSKIHTVFRDLFGDHPIREPEIKDGIVETYSTPGGSLNAQHLPDGQQPPHPIYQILPMTIRKFLHKRYLSAALDKSNDKDSSAHFWTHLQDISNDPQSDTVQWFIEKAAHHRDNYGAQILTMSDLNNEIRKNG